MLLSICLITCQFHPGVAYKNVAYKKVCNLEYERDSFFLAQGKRISAPKVDITEAVVRKCSVKKVFLEISQNPQENTCARDSFLIKLQLYQKRVSGTGVFL